MTSLPYGLIRPLLFQMDAETAHDLALWALKTGLVGGSGPAKPSLRLATTVAGLNFPNPVGLAAGFDKNASAMGSLLRLGFGFIEVGTITPKPQSGNPKPRLFRTKETEGVINRFGFNGAGMEAAAEKLAHRPMGLIGVNIGANKDSEDKLSDYLAAAQRLHMLADYLTINISSPNTPGLRGLQDAENLHSLLAALQTTLKGSVPLFLKIAPDLDDEALADIVSACEVHKISGMIVSNTTISRPDNLGVNGSEIGGLSGRPLFELSNRILADVAQHTRGRIPLIGVGGIMSGDDAYQKILKGAHLIQLYSGMVYKGPGLAKRVVDGLDACLERDGYKSVTDAVGAAL